MGFRTFISTVHVYLSRLSWSSGMLARGVSEHTERLLEISVHLTKFMIFTRTLQKIPHGDIERVSGLYNPEPPAFSYVILDTLSSPAEATEVPSVVITGWFTDFLHCTEMPGLQRSVTKQSNEVTSNMK